MERLRNHVPLVAFILLAALCLLLIGLACACLTDHPAKAADRAVAFGGELQGVIEVWSAAAVMALLGGFFVVALLSPRATGRASPALLQRFLF